MLIKEIGTRFKKLRLIYALNALIKARIQEKKVLGEQAYYEAKAKKMGIRVPQNHELSKLLQARFGKRNVKGTPKGREELHIFLAYRLNNWESVLPKALALFGVVTEFEFKAMGFDTRSIDWPLEREKMNTKMLAVFHKMNKKRHVDVVVGYLSGHNTYPETLNEMAKAGALILNFSWDDKLGFKGKKLGGRWKGPAEIASAVDLNLTNAPSSCIKYMVEDGLALFWPEAAHPDIHKTYDIPFEFDVSFVGARYGSRPGFISKLREKGLKIECFGNGWENGALSNEEMIKLYSRSRINIGFSGVGYSVKLMCLKGRDFEVPMSGGLYLTQHNPELELVYDVGREIVTYEGVDDCYAKIKWLLFNPNKAANIRKSGLLRALTDHTWQKRFRMVFKLAGLIS